MPRPQEVVPDILPRLRKASREVLDARAALADALMIRDRTVIEAVDAGISQKVTAQEAGLTRTRVNAILGNAGFIEYV